MHALISYSINFKFSHNLDKYISNHFVFFLFSHTLLFICALHNNLYLYNLMHDFTNHFCHSIFLHNLYKSIFHLSVSLHFSSTSSFILASHNNYSISFLFYSLVHALISHSIHFIFSHNIHNYISNSFVSLYFTHTSSFILASQSNSIFFLNLFSHACPYFSFNLLQIFTQYIQLYFKSFC